MPMKRTAELLLWWILLTQIKNRCLESFFFGKSYFTKGNQRDSPTYGRKREDNELEKRIIGIAVTIGSSSVYEIL